MSVTVLPASGPARGRLSRRALILLLVTVLAAVAAGWWLLRPGGSTGPAAAAVPVPAATVTKARFIASGDRVCAVMNRETRALGPMPHARVAAASYVDAQVVIASRTLARLEALPAPAADLPRLRAMYAQVAALDLTGRQLAVALRTGALATADRLTARLVSAQKQVNAAFDGFGLTVCGS